MWEASDIPLNSLYSPLPPTGEYTFPFIFFPACQKVSKKNLDTFCISIKKKKEKKNPIIQNVGFSETCVQELDEKIAA